MLFLSPNTEDYLADSLLHGLRTVLGERLVDYPKREVLYDSYPPEWRRRLYGNGFTLYAGLLPDIPIERVSPFELARRGEFDLVIVGDIWRKFGDFVELLPDLDRLRLVALDGSDSPAPYPYGGRWWRARGWRLLPRAHTRVTYFKRELSPATLWFRSYLTVPPAVARRLSPPRNMRPISFSIPAEKIVHEPPAKTKLFPSHIVDAEVAAKVGAQGNYAFDDEDDYYADLRSSRFGVTTRRGGWDALRHYELAASGCVLCFRDLHEKPATCAPHGLDETNCVSYSSADELLDRVRRMDDAEYAQLQARALSWARANSTRERAIELLRAVGFDGPF